MVADDAEPTIDLRRRTAILFCIVVFAALAASGWGLSRVNSEAQKRKTAFCGLAYLFDESIRLQGTHDLGPLQKPYDDWKHDIGAIDCPRRPRLTVPTTTSTTTTSPSEA